MCLLEKLFIFNLVKPEPKKVISFKSYLDFSKTHDFREMTISILHVMTSSKMLTSAGSFELELTLRALNILKIWCQKHYWFLS